MFNLNIKFLLAALVLTVGGVTAASAQLSKGSAIKANIATEFVVSGKSFPAGAYTIERMPGSTDSGSFLILRGDNDRSMIFDTIESESTGTAKSTSLVFENVDGVEYLSKIFVSGDNVAIEVPKTKPEVNVWDGAEFDVKIPVVQNPGF